MHRCQRLVHPSKQFWKWFCGMAFRAAVVLLLMSSMSSKCLPFNISFIFGNRKKSLGVRSGEQAGCSKTIICLVAKNSLTDSAVWAGALSWWKIHELLAKISGRFHLFHAAFSVLQNSKLGWLFVLFVQIHNEYSLFTIKFANFIFRPRISQCAIRNRSCYTCTLRGSSIRWSRRLFNDAA